MSVIDVFPKRPLQITAYYQKTTIWGMIGYVVAIGFLSFATFKSTTSLLEDYKLRDTGTVAATSHLENGVCHMWLVNDCEYDAEYTTADGTSHTRHVELMMFFQEVDNSKQFIVRYDPAAPEAISTSWGTNRMVNRTITSTLAWLLLLSMIPLAISSLLKPGKLRRKMTAIGAQPTPVEARFINAYADPRRPVATISYVWTDQMGVEKKSSNELRGAREPFWLDAAKTRVLAIVGPNGDAQLMDEGLAQVSLTNEERARIIQERNRTMNMTTPVAAGFRPA